MVEMHAFGTEGLELIRASLLFRNGTEIVSLEINLLMANNLNNMTNKILEQFPKTFA